MSKREERRTRPAHMIEVSGDLSRRRFVQGLGFVAGGMALSRVTPAFAREPGPSPFTLGVASGDPDHTSVVLWTRLAPQPLELDGGMPTRSVPVRWEVASDEGMRNVIARGATIARPEFGHSVLAYPAGLPANRWLWYRFYAMGEASSIGRTRTFPAPGDRSTPMKFVISSCQDYQNGFYAAWRDAVEQEVDFVAFLGDYMYEYGPRPGAPRQHVGEETVSVEDYRRRYAQYRLDPNLRAIHESCPFIVTWDDHEVDNNYAGPIPEDDQSFAEFAERTRNAYQVYAETMPIRGIERRDRIVLPSTQLYRTLRFGSLAEINVLDTRQYRTDQPCGDGLQFLCPEALAPGATLTGNAQEEWLFANLRNSTATWNVIAQQIMMMQWDLGVLAGARGFFNMDAWDGYPLQRQRIMNFLAEAKPNNPVVITGDIHSSWAADLKADFNDPDSETVGAEFVGDSISSNFGEDNDALVRLTIPSNPHIKFFDGLYRGYALCTVDNELWRTDFRAVEDVRDPDSPVFTQASFGVEAGKPGTFPL